MGYGVPTHHDLRASEAGHEGTSVPRLGPLRSKSTCIRRGRAPKGVHYTSSLTPTPRASACPPRISQRPAPPPGSTIRPGSPQAVHPLRARAMVTTAPTRTCLITARPFARRGCNPRLWAELAPPIRRKRGPPALTARHRGPRANRGRAEWRSSTQSRATREQQPPRHLSHRTPCSPENTRPL